jgi:hypothetical protein
VLAAVAGIASPASAGPAVESDAVPLLGASRRRGTGLVRGCSAVVAVAVHRGPRTAHHKLPLRAPEGGD